MNYTFYYEDVEITLSLDEILSENFTKLYAKTTLVESSEVVIGINNNIIVSDYGLPINQVFIRFLERE